jgi:thiamine kinase-like enzyme
VHEELKVFEQRIPWILSMHETNQMYLGQMSRGDSQLIQILRQHPEFPAALQKIKNEWVRRTLIHGDIKWENLVLCRENETAEPQLRLIDWEMADIGDDCWDAGAVLHAYLCFWIFSLPLTAAGTLDQAVAASPFDAQGLQPAMAAFWASYSQNSGLDAAGSRRVLHRCMACAAARMIQTAYEGIQQSPQITPHAICQLQMSMNILRDPAAAVQDLLGL